MKEENLVRAYGELIGYGRMMRLCEKLWRKSLGDLRGGEFSVGPCVAMLVPCPHPERSSDGHCDWCCGSGRVTKRVLAAAMGAVTGPTNTGLSQSEMKAQGARCGCRGSDDYCVCQNVPDRVTLDGRKADG